MQEAETLTAQGDVPGTLAYIAPERLAGDEATEASDVWAVGLMLWEALAGRHPFWTGSMLETARAIEGGAPPLVQLRPDLPKALLAVVDRALSRVATRRPTARELASALRGAAPKPPRRRRPGPGRPAPGLPVALASRRDLAARAGGAALTGGFAGWAATAMPFFPPGWWLGLGALVAAISFVRPRLALALALAVPVLPLGNDSLGLALLYCVLALGWLVVVWPEPRSGLLVALGPLLAPIAALGLLPLAGASVRSPLRRAVQVTGAVVLAAVASGLAHAPLPFTGEAAPLGIGVTGSEGPLDVAGSLVRALLDQPAIVVEALVLAAVAALLPLARRFGRWGATGLAAAMLTATILPVPAASWLPLALAAWLVWLLLSLDAARRDGT
jgi:hypothetical protein